MYFLRENNRKCKELYVFTCENFPPQKIVIQAFSFVVFRPVFACFFAGPGDFWSSGGVENFVKFRWKFDFACKWDFAFSFAWHFVYFYTHFRIVLYTCFANDIAPISFACRKTGKFGYKWHRGGAIWITLPIVGSILIHLCPKLLTFIHFASKPVKIRCYNFEGEVSLFWRSLKKRGGLYNYDKT